MKVCPSIQWSLVLRSPSERALREYYLQLQVLTAFYCSKARLRDHEQDGLTVNATTTDCEHKNYLNDTILKNGQNQCLNIKKQHLGSMLKPFKSH